MSFEEHRAITPPVKPAVAPPAAPPMRPFVPDIQKTEPKTASTLTPTWRMNDPSKKETVAPVLESMLRAAQEEAAHVPEAPAQTVIETLSQPDIVDVALPETPPEEVTVAVVEQTAVRTKDEKERL